MRACVRACASRASTPALLDFGICNTETSMHDNCSPSSLLGDIHSLLQQLHNHINNSPQQSKLLKIRDALKDMTAHLECDDATDTSNVCSHFNIQLPRPPHSAHYRYINSIVCPTYPSIPSYSLYISNSWYPSSTLFLFSVL